MLTRGAVLDGGILEPLLAPEAVFNRWHFPILAKPVRHFPTAQGYEIGAKLRIAVMQRKATCVPCTLLLVVRERRVAEGVSQ
ncbi:hypothetical protein D9M71_489660 [compost metagenome]